jgi:hypothetical protein
MVSTMNSRTGVSCGYTAEPTAARAMLGPIKSGVVTWLTIAIAATRP